MTLSRYAVLRLLLGMAFCAGGCSEQIRPPASVPVEGTVLVNGKPAAGIVVRFHPQFDIGPVKFVPLGETGKDGRFRLSTGANSNGAPPGDYLVTFEKPRIISDRANSGIEMEVDDFKGQFSDPAASGNPFTIRADSNPLPPFELVFNETR